MEELLKELKEASEFVIAGRPSGSVARLREVITQLENFTHDKLLVTLEEYEGLMTYNSCSCDP